MIFSKEKWNEGYEIKQFVKVSKALTFATMEAPLNNAFHLFLVPLLGDNMTTELIEIYKYGPNPNIVVEGEAAATEQEKLDWKLLQLCQRANANLAFWYDFDELNVRITDSGFQRQESDSFKPAFKYQENNLRYSFRNKGFNALDEVLLFLETNIETYPEFKESGSYTLHRNAIVRSTDEVNQTYFINNSRLVFLRLQTHFSFVQDNILRPALGESLYNLLITSLVSTTLDDSTKQKIESLRIKSGKVIIMHAVKRLMAETGTITDRGLYFTTIQANKDGDENIQPVEVDRISAQLKQASSDADVFMSDLMKHISRNFTDMYAGNTRKALDRDNDNKTTFWA